MESNDVERLIDKTFEMALGRAASSCYVNNGRIRYLYLATCS